MTTVAIIAVLEAFLLTTKDASNNDYFTNTAEVKAVDMGSYQMLDKGVQFAAVLLPGRIGDPGADSYSVIHQDDVLMDLFARYDSDAATNWDNFTIFRDAIRAKLEGYPTLNGLTGVQKVTVAADDDPGAIVKGKSPEAGPIFIIQRLRVQVSQRTELTTGEYAP